MNLLQKSNKKFTKIYHGLIPALIIPIISVFVFYLVKYSSNKTFTQFINFLHQYDITEKIISLCVIPNLLLFFIFIWTDRYTAAKGVILATLIYTVLTLLSKNI